MGGRGEVFRGENVVSLVRFMKKIDIFDIFYFGITSIHLLRFLSG